MFYGLERGVTMFRTAFLILLTSIAFVADIAAAEPATGQIAVVARAPDNPNVEGIRLSLIYGKNDRMGGLDLGLVSMSESRELSGAAFVLGLHRLTGGMDGGAAFSLVNLHSGRDAGLNAAFVNMVETTESAVNLGFVNIAGGKTMVDVAAINVANATTAQVGFVNVTKRIEGVQIGFINVADNGFFRVFPFFNFPKRGD